MLQSFLMNCREDELSERTINKYRKDISDFLVFGNIKSKEDINKAVLLDYKEELKRIHAKGTEIKVSSINNKIIIINKFLVFIFGNKEYNLKKMKEQINYNNKNLLTKEEYQRLLIWARNENNDRLYFIMRVLAETGIRISELQYLEVESLSAGIRICNKGKYRIVPIPKKLKKDLLNYCRDYRIESGIIFRTKSGKPIDNAYIYKQMQELTGKARGGLKKSKVHPHNFRHLFAFEYLKNGGNVLNLADILGHSSIETTRLYTRADTNSNNDILEKMYR